MNDEELKDYMSKVHNMLFEQLCDIDRVCRENDIDYSLIAGTLLGAVRYHDFIPWDDDADIVMTRENFCKFDSIYEIQKNNKFSYGYDGQWLKRISHAKPVEYKGITLDRVCTDIFIFDNTPDNLFVLKFKILFLKVLQGMIKESPSYSSYGLLGKIASFVTNLIGKPFSAKSKLNLYEDISKIGNKEETKNIWLYNSGFPHLNYSVNKSIISSYTDIPLHGHSFMVFNGYKDFLKVLYGQDYLIPPPVAKRVPQHIPSIKINY